MDRKSEIKELWDEYRIAKCFISIFEEMHRRIIFKNPKQKISRTYHISKNIPHFEPPAGSSFWIQEHEPPWWFAEEMYSYVLNKNDKKSRLSTKREKRTRREKKLMSRVKDALCPTCLKRDTCQKICPEVERMLPKMGDGKAMLFDAHKIPFLPITKDGEIKDGHRRVIVLES